MNLRFIYRWGANTLVYYLGFYLVDTLISPCFYLPTSWIAIALAAPMAFVNSAIRPFPRFKDKRKRSFGFFGLNVLGNYLFMQIIALLSSALQGNPFCIIVAAIFLTLLGALINYIIGFRPKPQPDIPTREPGAVYTGTARQVRQTDLRGSKKIRKRTKRARAKERAEARARARARTRNRT